MASSKNLKNEAYQFLKKKILMNELAPNEYLEEKKICEWTGMSRTPIREAINRLAQEGLVTVIPNKGGFVASLDIQRVRELFEARIELEPMVLKKGFERIDPEVMERFRREFEEGLEKKDYPFLHEKDYEFHNYLNSLCGNEFLVRTMDHLQDLFQMIRTQDFYSRERTENGAREHIQMIDLAGRGDREAMAELLILHIQNTERYYYQSLVH